MGFYQVFRSRHGFLLVEQVSEPIISLWFPTAVMTLSQQQEDFVWQVGIIIDRALSRVKPCMSFFFSCSLPWMTVQNWPAGWSSCSGPVWFLSILYPRCVMSSRRVLSTSSSEQSKGTARTCFVWRPLVPPWQTYKETFEFGFNIHHPWVQRYSCT